MTGVTPVGIKSLEDDNKCSCWVSLCKGISVFICIGAFLYSGNTSLEAAVTWVVEHESDPDIDQMPMV